MTPLFLALLLTAAPPTAKEAVAKYDAVMAPDSFKGTAVMTSHRDDGSTRSYKMTMLKGSNERFRIWFAEPAAVRGQEMLRNGENFWVYMPNLKRSIRLASRDNFQGGDFNNADVLRANYSTDYDATLEEDAAKPDTWLLKLKAKTNDTSYDTIKLWISREPLGMPVRGEYFTASGKMLRSAEFLDVKDFGHGLKRPSLIKMRNEIATQRWSEMTWEACDITAPVSEGKFGLTDLGH